MAEVYEILRKNQRCALKVLQVRFDLDEVQNARAKREAQLLVHMRHPNVVNVQEADVHEGIFWMRMELLSGLDLREAMHRLGPMSVALACCWIRQAAYGAHQCHELGVVHRDIKPENIFLVTSGIVKLLDFGIAKIVGDMRTLAGGADQLLPPVGTPPYMSPEHISEGKATPASDVYALGMTFWEMMRGHHPLLPDGVSYDYWAMLRQQVHGKVPPLSEAGFPRYLSRVVERAVSKDPRERQPNGLAFATELDAACQRYADEHPDEDTHPGEPALAWLLGEADEPPSFGTGPSSGERSRRSGAFPTGPAPRFCTDPSLIVPGLAEPLPPEPLEAMDRDTDPMAAPPEAMDRDTDPMAVPLEIRRFDTISLPPPLRDPSAALALARYRPRGAERPRPPPIVPPRYPAFNAPPPDPPPEPPDPPGRATTLPPPPSVLVPRSGPRARQVALWILFALGWSIALVLITLRLSEWRRSPPIGPLAPSARPGAMAPP